MAGSTASCACAVAAITLVALMLPYTIVFAAVWTLLLVLWMAAGLELGPAGPLRYAP